MKLIYLATPYSHEHPGVRESRFRGACRIAAYFMRRGYYVFSPIAHTHPIAEVGDLPKGWDYWQAYGRAMLFCCSELWVVEMVGWETSVGIKGEIEIARELGLPIKRVRYADDTIGFSDLVVVDDEPGFSFPTLAKAIAAAQRCPMCDRPLDPSKGESAGAGCRDCTEFAIESVGAPGSVGSDSRLSRTSTGLTADPDPGYDRDMAHGLDNPTLFEQQRTRLTSRHWNAAVGRHWGRENGLLLWADLDDLTPTPNASDSAPQAVPEPQSASGEGGTSAQTPDREPQTAPGALPRVYGYGIVDKDDRPYWDDSCVCEDRGPMDDTCANLNEYGEEDGDPRAPYRVVRLIVEEIEENGDENPER